MNITRPGAPAATFTNDCSRVPLGRVSAVAVLAAEVSRGVDPTAERLPCPDWCSVSSYTVGSENIQPIFYPDHGTVLPGGGNGKRGELQPVGHGPRSEGKGQNPPYRFSGGTFSVMEELTIRWI